MRNYEKYAEEIKKHLYNGRFCGEFIVPKIIKASTCSGMSCVVCRMLQMLWLLEDYEEPETDWSTMEVDTPILVRDTEYDEWEKGHFAKYENGKICVWCGGQTSWTAEGAIAEWKYAKLAESEEE